jgi:hypothetical protein
MRHIVFSAILLLACHTATAFEFHLQFPAQPGARNLSVIGYHITGNTVVGNCSYISYSICSGRGCHSIPRPHYNTCTWDLHGNLLSVIAGAPPAQTPLYTSGSEIVYATEGKITTGRNTGGFGFVNTPAAHYTWQTANPAYSVIPFAADMVSATLISDGDLALNIKSASVLTKVSGGFTATSGTAAISKTSCNKLLSPGATCTLTIHYDPTSITCTGSPYSYAYTGIDLSLISNAAANPDFTENFTITGVPLCDQLD